MAISTTDSIPLVVARSAASSDSRPWIRRHLGPCLLLSTIALAIYAPAIRYEFLNWDDPLYVTRNPLVQSWDWQNLRTILTEPTVRNFAPLNMLAYLVQHSLFGLWAGGYHLVNMLVHAVNVVLVCRLMHELSGRRQVGYLTAFVFAIHPVQVETVAWVSSFKGLLSATFILLCLIDWCRAERTGRNELRAVIWLLLALFTKAIAVVVPAIMLSYDWLIRRRPLAECLARVLLPGLASVWVLLLNMSAQSLMVTGLREHLALSRLEILGVDTLILSRYVSMMLLPDHLSVLYDPPLRGIAVAVGIHAGIWIAVLSAAWGLRRRCPACAFAVATYFFLLLPVLNLFPLTTLMNDRYLYLPMVAFFGLLFSGIVHGIERLEQPRLKSAVMLAALLLITVGSVTYVRVTVRQLTVWQDSLSLWRHAVVETPRLALARFALADALEANGQFDDARRVIEQALAECNPDELDRDRMHRRLEKLRDYHNAVQAINSESTPPRPVRAASGESSANPSSSTGAARATS